MRPEDSISNTGAPDGGMPLPGAPSASGRYAPAGAAHSATFGPNEPFLFKLRDATGGTYRASYAPSSGWDGLRAAFVEQLGPSATADALASVTYVDDDGDACVISSDETLIEAVRLARAAGQTRLALTACSLRAASSNAPSMAQRAASGAASAIGATAGHVAPELDGAPPMAAAFLGGLIAASSVAVGVGLLAVKGLAASK